MGLQAHPNDVLVVRELSQGRRHPQFGVDQLITMYQPHQLAHREPRIIWFETLGTSPTALIMREVMEELAFAGTSVVEGVVRYEELELATSVQVGRS